jgi:hypothetical protein
MCKPCYSIQGRYCQISGTILPNHDSIVHRHYRRGNTGQRSLANRLIVAFGTIEPQQRAHSVQLAAGIFRIAITASGKWQGCDDQPCRTESKPQSSPGIGFFRPTLSPGDREKCPISEIQPDPAGAVAVGRVEKFLVGLVGVDEGLNTS